jgi:hypothetical protein
MKFYSLVKMTLNFLLVEGDDPGAPEGYQLLTPDEAREFLADMQSQGVLDKLEWGIIRLANGGSMDGPGYGYKIRDEDDRDLGHSLYVQIGEESEEEE